MASSCSSPSIAAWRCGWRIRCTARCAAGARHPPVCGGCAGWSPPSSPHPMTATTSESVVRRATLSLDSDLPPDADLLVRAAHGAVWLADLPLADRLAEAAIRAGAGPEPNFVRAHALSWLSRGEEADAVLAEIRTSELTDGEHARFAFLRASNMLWALADPARAKEIIDDACAHHTAAGTQLYRRLPHDVLVCDGPAGFGDASVERPCIGRACPQLLAPR